MNMAPTTRCFRFVGIIPKQQELDTFHRPMMPRRGLRLPADSPVGTKQEYETQKTKTFPWQTRTHSTHESLRRAS